MILHSFVYHMCENCGYGTRMRCIRFSSENGCDNQPSTLPPRRIGQLQYPRRILGFHHRQPEQCSDFLQISYSLRLTGSTISSPGKDDDVSALRLLDRSPQPIRRRRSRSPSENGTSGRNYSSAIASASPAPPEKPSRRGATLHR
jgi:hypothetical protein